LPRLFTYAERAALYNVLKFLHVLSVIVWVGGMIMLLLLNRRLARLGDPAVMRALGQQTGALSMVLFMPAVLVAVITGIGMIQVADLGFGRTWIMWGLIGTVVSFILGGVLTGGTARKLAQQVARGEIDQAGAAKVQQRILMFAVLNLILLLSIVWAMVAKPT
jgi:uncharacterized membrane protein